MGGAECYHKLTTYLTIFDVLGTRKKYIYDVNSDFLPKEVYI